jgi:hypothetical protein
VLIERGSIANILADITRTLPPCKTSCTIKPQFKYWEELYYCESTNTWEVGIWQALSYAKPTQVCSISMDVIKLFWSRCSAPETVQAMDKIQPTRTRHVADAATLSCAHQATLQHPQTRAEPPQRPPKPLRNPHSGILCIPSKAPQTRGTTYPRMASPNWPNSPRSGLQFSFS